MRILAVDDEPNILELLKAILEAEGNHKVTTTASGRLALEIIDQADVDFDCLLLDIQMPEMNGIDLCEKVRTLPDYANVPIIMLTAMSQKTYIDKAFSVGATDYVTKPFDFLELKGRLNSAAKIVHEYHRACDTADAARRLAQDLEEPAKPHVDEPLFIDGVDRLVSYSAFENFVLALSRTKLLFATSFAIKIADFKSLHETLSARDMRAMLKTLATVIVEQNPGDGNVVSYRGNGVFLCLNQKKSNILPDRRMAVINQAMDTEKQIRRDMPLVQVEVGHEVSLGSISRSGALLALRRAVDQIERHPMAPKELAELSRRVLRSTSRTQEQSNLERRAYEIILQDIVRDERRQVG